MAGAISNTETKRYAVVTGANKGIGIEVCRQLAAKGIIVVLTARDEKRGIEAVEKLNGSGLPEDHVIFHQLDVVDPSSVASLAHFVKAKFGKLDILVNNAGIAGVTEANWEAALVALATQFEDFQMKWAFETLQRYRKKCCMFNDDIQGTAGVALAGLLGTVRAQGRPLSDFVNQKMVVVGAGSAGLGVLNMAMQAVSRMSGAAANPLFFLLDKDGLITKGRKDIDPAAAPFAKSLGEIEGLGLREGASLIEVVRKLKPHVLLGLSGVGGVFNEEVLKAMRESDSNKPAIFAMSNPTMNAECTAIDAFKHAGESIVFASGSPFKNVDLGNGKVGHVNQANNMYLFPGIGLGALLSGARFISDGMLQAAAERLASYMTDEEIQKGILYPSIKSIRHITAEVGAAVIRAAVCEELAEGHGEIGARELKQMSKEETVEYVTQNMWFPVYSPLVHEK